MIEPSTAVAFRVIRRNSAQLIFSISATLESLEIDHMDRYRIAAEIEQELNIDIDDGCIIYWTTVEDVLNDVRNLTP